ncbi:hypothetical protein SELMODRAFT_18695, partial [Selaginella moellendorffii]
LDTSCNLIIYAQNTNLWSTKTSNKGIRCVLRLHENGNLILYSSNNNVVWASNTLCNFQNCYEDAKLVMQNDCNLVLY